MNRISGIEKSQAQICENYRARLNRVFDVGSDELYEPQMNAD